MDSGRAYYNQFNAVFELTGLLSYQTAELPGD